MIRVVFVEFDRVGEGVVELSFYYCCKYFFFVLLVKYCMNIVLFFFRIDIYFFQKVFIGNDFENL